MDFGVSERKAKALEERMAACKVLEKDLEEKFVRSQGPGGQHVNKTSTCVLLTHRPSGITVKVQQSRSQLLNRFYARRQLCEHLEAQQLGQQSPEAQRIAKIRKQKDRQRRRRRARDKA